MKKEKILVVIAGPTAVGKTAVAISIAGHFHTEIISADSRQFFREMNIGTAKPSPSELARVKHHFINSRSITEDYDAATFGDEALRTVRQLFLEKDIAVLCGGSGLYIRAVCEGFDEIPETGEKIRSYLKEGYRQFGIEWLQEKMQESDPAQFALIDRQNPQRMMRALEVKIATGRSISSFRKKEKRSHDFRILKFGLELPREQLYKNIDARMDRMVAMGLFEEAERLYSYRDRNALQTVGYQEIFDFMDRKHDYDETVRLLKRNSRRYAKRQLTWFKRDGEMQWYDPSEADTIIRIIETYR